MITPEQLNEIPESFVKEIEELENYIISDIARRIAKEGEITDTAAIELNRALELGTDISVIERFIERVTGAIQEDIDIVLRGVIKESVDADNVIYKAAGYNPVDLKKSSKLMEIIEAGIRQTNSTLKNITGSMGFANVVGGKTVFQDIAKFYQNTLDFALLQVSTGVLDVNSAARFAVKKMADSGIRYVDYASGHVNRVDVAAKRAILTGVNQLNLRITDGIMEELGAEYVEVTAHAGARPDHAVWQGKVYHKGGEKDGYPDFESSTGYGTGPGLGGWNCRHSYFPFFPGISVRSYTDEQLENIDPPNLTYKGKEYTYYEATQKQRQMETQMRKTKRELVGFDALGMKDDFTAASIRLNNQKEAYRKFSKAAGLKPKFERTEEYGFTKSISQKSVWANRKYQNGGRSGIINKAKDGDLFRSFNVKNTSRITAESIENELLTSPIGIETIEQIRNSDAIIQIVQGISLPDGRRGDQDKKIITIYLDCNRDSRVAAQTVIHEMTHYYYDIGNCQWAEAVCFAKEKMHIVGRNELTFSEKRQVVKLARENYPEYNWKRGGYENGRDL